MISNLNSKINEFLNNEKISKWNFDDLKNVAIYTEFNENIMKWFRYLQSFETIGWRNKLVTKKLCKIFSDKIKTGLYETIQPRYEHLR